MTGSRTFKPKAQDSWRHTYTMGVLIETWLKLMSGKIVLSYRRSDSDVITGRIRDNLANHYGEDAVFMDIDSIPLGFDYREQMRDALSDNKVCPKACKGFAISMPAKSTAGAIFVST
ncbi:MAG TPA: hypothetical protein VGU64_04565 [Terriglobales bacterium]|jgi:hypothetical protein|nr:hypothetical protein [Terriglobales bacterium]